MAVLGLLLPGFVIAQPDLVVSNLSLNQYLPRGGFYFAIASVANVGSEATPAGTVIGVSWWADGELRFWHDETIGPLQPGEQIQVLPNGGPQYEVAGLRGVIDIPPGREVMAWVDDTGRIQEINEGNNQRTIVPEPTYPYTWPDAYDLMVQRVVTEPENPKEGDQVLFGAEILNRGREATPSGVTHGILFSVNDQPVSWSDNFAGPLQPGESRLLWANGGPEGSSHWAAQTGYQVLEGWVDDQNRITKEMQEYENRLAAILKVEAAPVRPDLVVRNIELIKQEGPDYGAHSYAFRATIQNAGDGPSPDSVVHGVAFSVDGEAVAWHDESTEPLAPGQQRTVISNGGPDGNGWHDLGGPGSWQIAAHVDDVNRIAESNDQNNRFQITFQIEPVVGPFGIQVHPSSQAAAVGESASFRVEASGSGELVFQWRKNGREIAGATGSVLNLEGVGPEQAGVYSVLIADGTSTLESRGAILGVTTADRWAGAVHSPEVFQNILHPNGNIYDQVLLTGTAATITADPGQVTRISFLDLNDDIIQVEFSGSGTLTLVLENPSGPALPRHYAQEVQYMRGHPSLIVQGAGSDTYISAFSVGQINAVDQSLFRGDVIYDGVADLARLAILSASGEVGSLLMGNAGFFDTSGRTGLYAPGVSVSEIIRLHDLTAFGEARPVLVFGASPGGVHVAGGALEQANGRPVEIEGVERLEMGAGASSHGEHLPVQSIQARLMRGGEDVTQQVVSP